MCHMCHLSCGQVSSNPLLLAFFMIRDSGSVKLYWSLSLGPGVGELGVVSRAASFPSWPPFLSLACILASYSAFSAMVWFRDFTVSPSPAFPKLFQALALILVPFMTACACAARDLRQPPRCMLTAHPATVLSRANLIVQRCLEFPSVQSPTLCLSTFFSSMMSSGTALLSHCQRATDLAKSTSACRETLRGTP